MNKEEQVVNKQLSKELSKLNIVLYKNEDSYFHYVNGELINPTDASEFETSSWPARDKWIKTFNVPELLSILPCIIKIDRKTLMLSMGKALDNKSFFVYYLDRKTKESKMTINNKRLANALAKMLIVLKLHKII